MQTKNFYIQETNVLQQSQPTFLDLGYSLDIPWNDIFTNGWYMKQPGVWGQENMLITSDKPEYFAPDNVVRSNYIPSIDVDDPIYHYKRENHTFKLY
jgi:hypothetical protein